MENDSGLMMLAGAPEPGSVFIGHQRRDEVMRVTDSTNEQVFVIYNNGLIEVNPKYTVDDAARLFWLAVARCNPVMGSGSFTSPE